MKTQNANYAETVRKLNLGEVTEQVREDLHTLAHAGKFDRKAFCRRNGKAAFEQAVKAEAKRRLNILRSASDEQLATPARVGKLLGISKILHSGVEAVVAADVKYMAYNHNGTELMQKPGTKSEAAREAREYRQATGNSAYYEEVAAKKSSSKHH